MKNLATWNAHNVFTIEIKGTGEFVKKIVSTLEETFNEPHEDETERDEEFDNNLD